MDESELENLSSAFNEELGYRIQSKAGGTGILWEFNSEFVQHLGEGQVDEDGEPADGAAIEAAMTFRREPLEEGDADAFMAEIERAGTELGQKIRQTFLRRGRPGL